MSRWMGAVLGAISIASILAEEELPTHEGEEALDVEPPLLIQSRGADGSLVVAGAPVVAPDVDIAKTEAELERAKKRAAGADRLYRAGIIAKVDAEERVLKVVRLEAKLADAQLQAAKRKVDAEKANAPDVEGAKQAAPPELAQATETAERTAKEKQKAELEAALRNLQRQQKLLALGSGRKADVSRAAQKLAELQKSQE